LITKTKTALVIGCNGQDGALICNSLLKKGYKVIGGSRNGKDNLDKLNQLGIAKEFEIKKADIKNSNEIENLISYCQPETIFNLAAQSSVGKSINQPIDTIEGIVNGTLNLLEVSRKINYTGKIFFAGSCEMFGNTEIKADIHHKQNPMSPYGIAKQTSFNLVKLYREIHSLKCVTGVFFNHESHLRNESFVTQKIVKSAYEIKNNRQKKLKLGNIDIIRDWGWAPEYIEAVQLITNSPNLKDHIICSGVSNSLKIFIEKVFNAYGLNWHEHIEIDKNFLRQNEIKSSYGDPNPLYKDLGWKAKVDLDSIIVNLIKLSNRN
jgi:GDPmannose 4,6-dehydratase